MSDHNIRRFTAYRPAVPTDTHNEDQRNAPDEVQYEGVVFTDGTCVLRWRTAVGSFSVWNSFEEAMRIHGHPEYGTRIVFHDEPVRLPWEPAEPEIPAEIQTFASLLGALFGEPVKVRACGSLEGLLKEIETANLPTPAEAWAYISEQLDEDCGYEGDELDDPEIAEHVERVRQCWDVLDDYFEDED